MAARSDIAGLYADSLDGTPPVRILPYWTKAVFVPSAGREKSGYLLFQQENTLMAQPFDPVKLRTTGAKSPVAERVGDEAFSASQNAVLAYGSGEAGQDQELVWMDRSGKRLGLAGSADVYRNLRLAPDEKRAVFERGPVARSNLWVLDMTRSVSSPFDVRSRNAQLPHLVHGRASRGVRILSGRCARPVRQSDQRHRAGRTVHQTEHTKGWGTDWSRDGRVVLYEGGGAETYEDLWIDPQFGDRKPFPYLKTQERTGRRILSRRPVDRLYVR